jgi:hypothetical protein
MSEEKQQPPDQPGLYWALSESSEWWMIEIRGDAPYLSCAAMYRICPSGHRHQTSGGDNVAKYRRFVKISEPPPPPGARNTLGA